MKRTKSLGLIFLLVAPIFVLPGLIQPVSAQQAIATGPRIDEVVLPVFTSDDALFLAMKAGQIQTADWNIPSDRVPEVPTVPYLNLDTAEDFGIFEFGANTGLYPTSEKWFRQAISLLVNRDRLVTEVMKGLGVALSTPVPPIYGDWANPAVKPIPYDPAGAEALLNTNGMTKNAAGKRIDPRSGAALPPIVIYTRSDDFRRRTAGEWLTEELKKLGFDVDLRSGPSSRFRAEVFCPSTAKSSADCPRSWHLGTTGWSLGVDLDYLYWFFTSKFHPVYTQTDWKNAEYDKIADTILYDPDFAKVKAAVYKAQEILRDEQPYIMLYARLNLNVFNTNYVGYVPARGRTLATFWSYFNMHPRDRPSGGVVQAGQLNFAEDINPLTYQWLWESRVLELVYDSLTAIHPYTLADIPWLAERWDVADWTMPDGTVASVYTFYLVKNATWTDGKPVTADDVKFTYDLVQKTECARCDAALFIVNATKVDQYTVKVFANSKSYWNLHNIQAFTGILPKHIWETVADPLHIDPWEKGIFVGSGPFKLIERKTGEYHRFIANTKYFRSPDIFMGVKNWLEPPKKLTLTLSTATEAIAGDKVTVKATVAAAGTPTSEASVVITLVNPLGEKLKEATATYSAADRTFIATFDTTGLPSGPYGLQAVATGTPVPVKATATFTFSVLSAEFRTIAQSLDQLKTTLTNQLNQITTTVNSQGGDIRTQRSSIASVETSVASLSSTLNITLGVAVIALIISLASTWMTRRKK